MFPSKRMIPRVPGRRWRRPAAAVLLAAGLGLALVSCDRTDPTYPDYRVGAVEGYVISAGEVCAAYVGVRALEGANEGYEVVEVATDSTGWYHMDLPTGIYRMGVGADDGISYPSLSDCDTLVVQPTTQRLDIIRGRAEVQIYLPDALDGDYYYLRLYDEYGRLTRSDRAYVENGGLEYIFPVLDPGEYTMRLDPRDQYADFYLPHVLNRSDGDVLSVDTETPSRYVISFRSSLAFLYGNVSGSWQIADAYYPAIELFNADSLCIGGVSTDSQGDFTCQLFVAQPVRVLVEIEGVNSWVGGDTYADATVFDVSAGDSLLSVSLVESGIQLTLDDGSFDTWLPSLITLTDETGTEVVVVDEWSRVVTICNLKPGRYYLHVAGCCVGETWAPQWYGGSETFEGAVPIDLTEGELVYRDMLLEPGGMIAGRLVQEDGSDYSVFQLGLFLGEDEPLCSDDIYDYFYDGDFEFTGLANGPHYIALWVDHSSKWWYPGTYDFSEAVAIEIIDHATVELETWTWTDTRTGGAL